jgi:hypothetical protein
VLTQGKYSVWFRTPLAEGTASWCSPGWQVKRRRYHNVIHRPLANWRRVIQSHPFRYPALARTGCVRGSRRSRFKPDRSVQGRHHRLMQGHRQASAGLDVRRHARPHGRQLALASSSVPSEDRLETKQSLVRHTDGSNSIWTD